MRITVVAVSDRGARRRQRYGRRWRAAREFRLDEPTLGLHLPPGIWGVQYGYSADAMLLVLASEYYDASDYIRDYEQFRALRSAR
jgi:hypothetical protein